MRCFSKKKFFGALCHPEIFSFGAFMTLNGIASLLLLQVQKYLIGITLGPASVAVYQTASVPPGKIHAAVNAATARV